jgi:hypothetical protein
MDFEDIPDANDEVLPPQIPVNYTEEPVPVVIESAGYDAFPEPEPEDALKCVKFAVFSKKI